MKIQNSSISMSSTHSYSSFSHVESVHIEGRAADLEGVILNLSKAAEDGSLTDAIDAHKKQQEEAAKKRQEEALKNMFQPLKTNEASGYVGTSDEYDLKLELLRQMLAMLNKGKYLDKLPGKNLNPNGVLDLRSNAKPLPLLQTGGTSIEVNSAPVMGTNGAGTVYTRVAATSGSFSEYESTTFASKGLVQTADGRSIEFDVSFGMSHACEMEFNSLEVSQYIVTDPLIINLDTDMPSISDQKFLFDLDTDGKEDEISYLGKGCGFLALDKNEDGVINDGNELFGTKSGDGFNDLAAYNEDGNLWIDENDSIFHKLKVWMKDEEGNDVLLSLKDADVGAIYLGNASTEHTLRGEEHKVNGILRKTGVYLKESTGKVGTVNHVDLAV